MDIFGHSNQAEETELNNPNKPDKPGLRESGFSLKEKLNQPKEKACEVMAEDQLPETLKPFFHRATEAQERLARLEAALASTKTDVPDAELVEKINQIQSKLEEANETMKQEQDKVEKLTSENEKQKYRILHLVRALKDADEKLEKLSK